MKLTARVTLHEIVEEGDRTIHLERKVWKLSGIDAQLLEQTLYTISGKCKEEEARDWSCLVCHQPDAYESYIVHDSLWASAGFDRGAVHLACFEKTIGRRITVDDLMPGVTMNNMLRHLL